MNKVVLSGFFETYYSQREQINDVSFISRRSVIFHLPYIIFGRAKLFERILDFYLDL